MTRRRRVLMAVLAALAGSPVLAQAAQQVVGSDTTRRGPVVLAPVVSTAEALASKLIEVGFVHRRAHSGAPASQFLTRPEIEKRASIDLGQLLRGMKGRSWGCAEGVLFIDGVLQAAPIPEPEAITVRSTPAPGRTRVGAPVVSIPMAKASPLDHIPVHTVDAIEVYTGPSEIPLEFKAAFRQARCVVAVWTR